METTMTLSQLADCIIGISHVIADLIFLIVSSIKKMLAKHKEKPEEAGDEKTE